MTTPQSIIEARRFSGRQEHAGPNNGPQLANMRRALDLPDKPMSWCGVFVSFCLLRYAVTRKALREALGFGSHWFPESTRDWLAQAACLGMLTDEPEPGDVFVLVDGSSIAHHMGFVVEVHPGDVDTIEGNTNAGGSPDGDGVYHRVRRRGTSMKFIRLPLELKA